MEPSSSSSSVSRRPVPISLGKPSLRIRLEAYYSLIAPQVVENEEWKQKFEQIYEKFGGTVQGEAALAAKLTKKYGDTVRLKLTTVGDDESPSRKKKSSQITLDSSGPVHDELWYSTKMENKSGILDFSNPDLDPVAALTVDTELVYQTNPFLKHASILDNLTKCAFLLPRCDPLSKQRLTHTNTNQTSQKKKTPRVQIPVFSALAQKYEHSGPLSFLHQLHTERKRIRVLVRYIDCIRGTLTGYLLAFDKHFNLILRDVDEVYTSRVTRVFENQDFSKSELESKRRSCISMAGKRQHDDQGSVVALHQRHVGQMLVRGDCIVSVWNAESEHNRCMPSQT